jgi:hypothetical protein
MSKINLSRKLVDGTEVLELDHAVELVVRTKCPNKYKLVDMETGEEYIGNNPNDSHFYWKKIKNA